MPATDSERNLRRPSANLLQSSHMTLFPCLRKRLRSRACSRVAQALPRSTCWRAADVAMRQLTVPNRRYGSALVGHQVIGHDYVGCPGEMHWRCFSFANYGSSSIIIASSLELMRTYLSLDPRGSSPSGLTTACQRQKLSQLRAILT